MPLASLSGHVALLFSGKRVVLKSRVDRRTAPRYIAAFKKALTHATRAFELMGREKAEVANTMANAMAEDGSARKGLGLLEECWQIERGQEQKKSPGRLYRGLPGVEADGQNLAVLQPREQNDF